MKCRGVGSDLFRSEHAREIMDRVCYLPVEYLQVEAEVVIAGLRLLSTNSDEMPRGGLGFVPIGTRQRDHGPRVLSPGRVPASRGRGSHCRTAVAVDQ